MRKFSELVQAMSPESQQRVADRVESALNGIVKTCNKCNGARTVVIGGAREMTHPSIISCNRCGGTGNEPLRPYYVIYFNRERRCIELHKPFCEHGVHKDMDTYYSLGGDSADPKEMVKTLPTQYRELALLIEDCLR